MNESATVSAQTEQVKKSIIAGKFNGALSRFQVAGYTDLVYAGMDKGTAHKIASDFGSDLGKLMSTDATFAAKIGKANKDGNSRIALSGGAKVKTSMAMSLIRVAQQVDGLYMEGLIKSRHLPELTKHLNTYITESTQWASEQTWE